MTPFFFGPPDRKLFGAFHRPVQKRREPLAVLVCNPLGQEYVRCHRMLRTLADRLQRSGISCLRFDYYGTGDSAGADEESLLSGWSVDLELAHEELRRRVGGCKILWLGVRLGAIAALDAAPKTKAPPAGLVLWEPIGHGERYLRYLAASYEKAVSVSYTLVPHDARQQAPGELIGFGTSSAMLDELRRIEPSRMPRADLPATWIMPPHPPAELAAPPSSATTVLLEHGFDWNSEEALNTALVPAPAVKLLFEQLEARG